MKHKIKIVAGAVAGLAFASFMETAAFAQATPQTLKVNGPSANDIARTRNGRLRKTDEAFTNEQGVVKFMGDGTRGIYVEMRTSSLETGAAPTDRMQCACTPIQLTQDPAGKVVMKKLPGEKFVTDNRGNEYRNCNKPELMAIDGGQAMLFMFNYQPNGTGDTRRYAKVLDQNCNELPITNAQGNATKQVTIMAKANDDCDMHQSGEGPCDVASSGNGTDHLTCWAGCNGNGRDDGWLNDVTVKKAGAGYQISKNFDISLAQREERSRGRCTTASNDPNTAICTWTEGNTQPQRDGTWIAAVDISAGGQTGANAQNRLLWKKQLDGRKDIPINTGAQTINRRTYSVRAKSTRLMMPGANGNLAKSDYLIIQTGDLRGRNNNNEKGGQYQAFQLSVVKATRSGLEYVIPMEDKTDMMLGVDGTHLTMCGSVFGSGANLTPGFTLLQGSHIGGGEGEALVKAVGIDMASKKFVDFGTQRAGAPYDRHLYANYLGNNPGNQGRNFAGCELIKNPFAGQNGSDVRYMLAHALTGKPKDDATKPEVKPSSYVSLLPVAGVAQNFWSARLTEEKQETEAVGCTTTAGNKTGSALLLFVTLGLMHLARRRRD